MANYLAKFGANLNDVTAPVRDLLKTGAEFVWDRQQERAFTKMKGIVTLHEEGADTSNRRLKDNYRCHTYAGGPTDRVYIGRLERFQAELGNYRA